MLGLKQLPRTLQAALRDVDSKRREVKLSALRDLGRLAREGDAGERSAALEGMSRLLGDSEGIVVGQTALELADVGARESVAELVRVARREERLKVLQLVLVALGELAEPGDEEALGPVRQALRAEDPELRYQALIAVARLAPEQANEALVSALADEDTEVRYIAVRLLEERWATNDELPEHLAARLRRTLEDEDRHVRLAAAILFGRRGSEVGAEVLCESLVVGARHADDAQAAIELCGELGLAAARPLLERRAFASQLLRRNDATAWHARVALAKMGHERARETLRRGLKAWTRDARTLAVAAVGRAGLAEAHGDLVAMRGDSARADPEAVNEALAQLEALVNTRQA